MERAGLSLRRRRRRPKTPPPMSLPLLLLLAAAAADIASAAPLAARGSKSSVRLNAGQKTYTHSETCPPLNYCDCKERGGTLDVTCNKINSYKLSQDTNELKAKERYVRYFKIRNSDIPKLDDHIFMGIKIEYLYIHNCNLKALGPQSVSSQGNTLSHLVLSKNELTEVPSEAIRSLKNLHHLNLNDNKIKALRKEAFLGLSKVMRLSLYNNKIHNIDPNAFDGLTRFMEMPEDHERDLTRLNLAKNQIDRVPKEALVPLKYLQHLDFSDNHIAQLQAGDFEGMDSLDHLTLNSNKLRHLGAEFFMGLDALTTLYIDHNQIRTINVDAFKGLERNLQSLSLSENQIEAFPSSALRRIHGLETLHMNDNKIVRLNEDAFQGFGEHIKHLWLQQNMIRDIPAPAFQDLHSLEWVKLFNNDLRTLTYELMEPVLDTLVHIDIHSNPLVCDCDLRWYRQWIEEEWNEIEETWLQVTSCKDPADGKEHNIAEVPLKDMFCEDDVTDKPGKKVGDGGDGRALAPEPISILLAFNTVLLLRQKWW